MSARTHYVIAELVRNPRRTLSTMVGVVLGVGLFCGVLFFVDGLSASMTQRAVEPLAIDMQRIVSQRAGPSLALTQSLEATASGEAVVALELRHDGDSPANEVTVRSVPNPGLGYIPGSATINRKPVPDTDGNPFAAGAARTGYNLGTIEPGSVSRIVYRVRVEDGALTSVEGGQSETVQSSFSSRESVSPIPADQPTAAGLDELAAELGAIDGVERAVSLSMADLGSGTLSATDTAPGPAKMFGFDAAYADGDDTVQIIEGDISADRAVISAELGNELNIGVGDSVTVALPDDTSLDLEVGGIANLSEARSLFSSRRGGDLETFIYVRHSVIVSSDAFAAEVFPAFERANAAGDGRLKSPPIREVDIALQRDRLDADPETAAAQTGRTASQVMAVAAAQDYLLDNITNTLNVASGDARVAKRLFVFLGVPGALLAAMLAAYAGTVLAEAQRREQAVLRIRGANRRQLLRMLALRTGLLTALGVVAGLAVGYGAAVAILGADSLARAGTTELLTSALAGTLGGYLATGGALYLTGRRSIDREINEDRRRMTDDVPLWRRLHLDVVGIALLAVGTIWALRTNAFAGAPGSVYFGRSVELNLALLVLPLAVWVAGSLVAARLIGGALRRSAPDSTETLGAAAPALIRRSIGRRPWPIGNAAIIVALIVALATSLAGFTASYDQAKINDARYANGADLRMTPDATSERVYTASDAGRFGAPGVGETTPVIYGRSNVILRSARTSDPANLAAVDPTTFNDVAPIDPATARQVQLLAGRPNSILLSAEMADFLQAGTGDSLDVLLARATPEQYEVRLRIVGFYERLPGFPDGADAVINLDAHTAAVPTKNPDFFLASTADADVATLNRAVSGLRAGAAAGDAIHIDTRASTLDTDQSSLAALNISGLVKVDSAFSLAMATAAVAIFVFGLLLQRRREYVVLRAQGLGPRTIRALIGAEAAIAAIAGIAAGVVVGAVMGAYFVGVLRPLFVLDPRYHLPLTAVARPVLLALVATIVSSLVGSRLIAALQPTELLRDD